MRKSYPRGLARAVVGSGALLHAATLVLDGMAVAFAARSGVGKTTLAERARRAGLPVIGDDSVVASIGTDGVLRAIPMPGSRFAGSAPAELGALVLLERGTPPVVRGVSPVYAGYRLHRDVLLLYMLDVPTEERSLFALGGLEIASRVRCFLARYSREEELRGVVERLEVHGKP